MPLCYSRCVPDEIDAMRQVKDALEPLSPEERSRVIRWAAELYGVELVSAAAQSRAGRTGTSPPAPSPQEQVNPQELGELYAQANPLTYADRALVVAYHLQAIQGTADFDAMTVNTQLKHLGHRVPNITQALNELKARRPQLVIQLQKSGKSRQARKRYKVTSAGQAEVRRMLSQEET